MANIVLRQEAIDDLNAIWNYTFEQWSENQADNYYTLLKLACENIGKNYESGREYFEIRRNLFGLKNRKTHHLLPFNFSRRNRNHQNITRKNVLKNQIDKIKKGSLPPETAFSHSFNLTNHFTTNRWMQTWPSTAMALRV